MSALFSKHEFMQTAILLITALIALWSALLFKSTTEKNIEFQAEASANETWASYRQILLAYPDGFTGVINYSSLSGKRKYDYQFLVERLLMSSDLVTFSLEKDAQWEGAFAIEFKKHQPYLLSDDFLSGKNGVMSEYCTYRRGVRNWLIRTFKNDRVAWHRLGKAERDCQSVLNDKDYDENA